MSKPIAEQKHDLRVEKLEEKLQDLNDYYKYMDMDLIYSEFDGDEIEDLRNADIIRVNSERDMFEVVNFEL